MSLIQPPKVAAVVAETVSPQPGLALLTSPLPGSGALDLLDLIRAH